jgi:TonB family protein
MARSLIKCATQSLVLSIADAWMKTCPQCNASVSDEYRFCLNCGTVLGSSANRAEEPLPTLVYQGPIATPDNDRTSSGTVPPTMPSYGVATSKKSTLRWLPWLAVGACIAIIVALVTFIVIQRRSSVTETVATLQTPEPMPTATSSEIVSNPNSNQPTPTSSVSPTATKQTPTPTPTPETSDPVLFPKSQPSSTAAPVEVITPTPTPTPTQTPTPAPAVDTNRVYSNREVSERARIASQPKPVYTDSARQNQIQGTVVLLVVLKFDGTIGSIRVVSGLAYGLTEQAIAAARNIKFTPAKKDGVPVSVSVQVEYLFSLY